MWQLGVTTLSYHIGTSRTCSPFYGHSAKVTGAGVLFEQEVSAARDPLMQENHRTGHRTVVQYGMIYLQILDGGCCRQLQ